MNFSFSRRVIGIHNEVNGFMLDPSIGEFVLTDPNMKIPSKGKIYSLNEGYEKKWEPAIYDFIRSKKEGPKSYSMRYTRRPFFNGLFLGTKSQKLI